MNYILHLAGFFDRVAKDDRLGPLHISMYVSLFQFWNASRFKNPISISRNELMRVSKICSKATYHKCIRELNEFGYLHYQPSFNPIRGSLVYLFNFEAANEQLNESKRTKIKTASRLVEEPYINNTNIINSKLAKEQAQAETSLNSDLVNAKEKKKSSAKRKREDFLPLPESLEEVKSFFFVQKSTSIEAEKFFNYFQSNGWKVGGRAPMKNWHAAARNWILNTSKFSGKVDQAVSFSSEKNYAEPL